MCIIHQFVHLFHLCFISNHVLLKYCRNIIEKSYWDKLKEREAEVSNPDNENLIRILEQDVSVPSNSPRRNVFNLQQNENAQAQNFCSGICVMGGIILVSTLFVFNSLSFVNTVEIILTITLLLCTMIISNAYIDVHVLLSS